MSLSARNWAWKQTVWLDNSSGELVQLTAAEKFVLVYLAERENQHEGYAWPSHQTISAATCLSLSSVKRAVKHLTALGMVRVERVRTPTGVWEHSRYYFDVVPLEYREADPSWTSAQKRPQVTMTPPLLETAGHGSP